MVLFAACSGGMTLLAGSVVTDRVGITDFYYSPPRLPDFAYPEGVVKTDEWESGGCGGASGGPPPCRQIFFRTDAPFDHGRKALLREFAARGWRADYRDVDAADHSFVLYARSDPDDVCIIYVASEPGPTAPRPAGYLLNIHVSVYECSKVPPP